MSRKRKRRGRGGSPEGGVPQEDSKVAQQDDIEIVDDVHILDEPLHQAGKPEAPTTAAATAAAAAADALPPATASDSDSTKTTGNEAHDAVVDAPADVPSPSVHVVEPLHESPVAAVEGDRTVETLGELLQHAREARGLSLEEVSARTRIALLTLRHLENDRFGELPAEAYVKGFLRSYGSFLSLDVSMLLRRYEKLSGHVSTPVAEIWDEVEVDRSSVTMWRPSRRTVAIASAVLIVAALAWVFWSQGAVMLGLRPEGELQQIEMQLQREASDGDTPAPSITGLDDAALQNEVENDEDTSASQPAIPKAAPGDVNTAVDRSSSVEDSSPPVPLPPLKPAPTVQPPSQPQAPAANDAASKKPAPAQPAKPVVVKPVPAAADTKAVAKPRIQPPARKPAKKPAPAPSPEDAAGPPG